MSASPRSIAISPGPRTSSASSRAWRSESERGSPPEARCRRRRPMSAMPHFMARGAAPGGARPRPGLAEPGGRLRRGQGRPRRRPRLDPARRPAACRDRGAEPGRRAGAGRDRLRHASSPAPTTAARRPAPMALLHAGIRRVVVATATPTRGSTAAASSSCARPASRSRSGCGGAEAERAQRRLLPARARRPAAGHPEARDLARRPHRDPHRREPLDHRRAGARRAAIICAPPTTRSWSAAAPRWPTIRS